MDYPVSQNGCSDTAGPPGGAAAGPYPGAQPGVGNPQAVLAGAPPSNTAPANYSRGPHTTILRTGIDSLYLSYPGRLSFDSDIKLGALKQAARSEAASERSSAILQLGEHYFEVWASARRPYAYTLADNAYHIQLSSLGARQVPLAYVQVRSQWLLAKGVQWVCDELRTLIERLGVIEEGAGARVSRADACCDFVCSMDLDDIEERAWVSRARRTSKHAMDRKFSGWSIGLGGDLSARLYDKTKEVEDKGNHHWKPVWHRVGWEPGHTVWRLEFQYERRVLKEHGIGEVPDLLERLGSVWRYSTLNWLKLTIPGPEGSNQSRWPLHPVWGALSEACWEGSGEGVSVPVRADRVPSDRYLFENGLSGITSYMALRGITDSEEAFSRYHQDAKAYHDSRDFLTGIGFDGYLGEKAADKARRFNVRYPGSLEKSRERIREAGVEGAAEAYRKERDGE